MLATAAGCSSSAKPNTVSTTTTTAPAPALGVAIGNGVVPPSPVHAVMHTYRSNGKPFSAYQFDFTPGNKISSDWYRMGDVWAVHFRGLDQATGAGKCAIAALETPTGRKFASETPYGQGSCDEFPDQVLPPGSLFRCGTDQAIVYKTQIPITANGTLTATLGRGYIPDKSVEGIRSRVAADASSAPAIAPSTGCFVVA